MIVSADEQDGQRDLVRASSAARRLRPARSCDRGSPGRDRAVTRTLISSEITRVPAVTAERSPPASRITGALSPVIAASLTLATPGDDLAVRGDQVARRRPARYRPTRSALAATIPRCVARARALGGEFRLGGAQRLAACALPRPSASASAKVPNSTVSHSQTTSCSLKPKLSAVVADERAACVSQRRRPRR